LDADETAHIRRVLRLKGGERIEGADGRGWIYTLALRRGRGAKAQAEVLDKRRPRRSRPLDVIVATGLIKGPRMDWAVEKAAELGARAFVPFRCERATARAGGKVQRWRRIARAALKQSLASHRMCVTGPRDFDYVLKLTRAVAVAIVGDSKGPPLVLRGKDLARRRSCLLVFGPEGGLSEAEAKALADAGARVFSLGPARLRTETAVVAGLAALWQSTA
jgi:16S rRNA (uracil1498-N3)-methyltransferase